MRTSSRSSSSSRARVLSVAAVLAAAIVLVLSLASSAFAAGYDYQFVGRWPSVGQSNYDPLLIPESVAVGPAGNIFVADTAHHRVQKYDNAGRYLNTFTRADGGTGRLVSPLGVTLDSSGNLYIADAGLKKIVMLKSNGQYIKSFAVGGTYADPPVAGTVDWPWGMTTDSYGYLYLADYYNNTVQIFDTTIAFPSSSNNYGCVTIFGFDDGALGGPSGVALDANEDLWIADAYTNRLVHYIIDQGATPPTATYDRELTDAGWDTPYSIAINRDGTANPDGDIFVADTYHNRVLKIDSDTGDPVAATLGGSLGTGDHQFDHPEGIAVDAADKVYVCDTQNNRVVKYADKYADDSDAPVTNSNIPDGQWVQGPFTVSLDSTDTQSGVDSILYGINVPSPTTLYWSVLGGGTGPFTIFAEGTTTVLYQGIDRKTIPAPNTEDAQTHYLMIDNHAPVTSTDATSAWLTTSAPVGFSVVDTLSGAAFTRYKLGNDPVATYTAPFMMPSNAQTQLLFQSGDNAGNVEPTRTITLRVDDTPPTTTSNVSGQIYRGSATITLTATDTVSGIAATYYSIDGSAPATPYTGPIVISAEGTTTVKYYSRDVAGNTEAVHEQTVVVDGAPPVTVSDVTSTWRSTPVTVTLSASDTFGVAHTYYRVNGGATTTYTAPFSISQEGVDTLLYWSVDFQGNEETPVSKQVRIDYTPPATGSNADDVWRTAGFSMNLTSADSLSGVGAIRYRINGSDPATFMAPFDVTSNGYNQIEFWGVDVAGNREATKTATVKIDREPPTSSCDATITSGQVSLTATDALTGVAATYYSIDGSFPTNRYTLPFLIPMTGRQTIKYYSVDVLGNAETVKTTTVNYDALAPVTTSNIDTNWHTPPFTVSLSAVDNGGSGVANTFYRIDGGPVTTYTADFAVSAEGTTTITYWSVDNIGNLETAITGYVKIDSVDPSSSSNADTAWHKGSFSLTLSATDNASGVATRWYRLNNGPQTAYSGPVTVSANGANTVEYWSTDVAGNVEAPHSATVKIDNIQPITGSNTDADWHGSPFSVVLSPDDDLSGPATTYYKVNGGSTLTYTAPFTVSTQGANTVSFWTVDAVGNVETAKTANVKVDLTAPLSSSNADASWHKDSFTVSLSSADTYSGVADIHYRVGNGAETTYTAPFAISSDGANTLSFWGVDTVGNREATRTATVKVDRTPPVTTSDAVGTYTTSANVHFSATDSGSGVGTTYYRIDGGTWTAGTTASTSVVGTHSVEWYSVDAVGNAETAHAATISVYRRYEQTTPEVVYRAGTWWTGSSGSYSGGSYKYTPNGGVFTAEFNGTALDWIATKGTIFGIAHVSVDGGPETSVDLYAYPTQYQRRVWSVSGLASGKHTLRIEWTGTKNASASATYVNIDALDVLGTISTDSQAPRTTSAVEESWQPNHVAVTLTADDAVSGVAATYYRLNGGATNTYSAPFTVSTLGTTTVTYWSVDVAGNTEAGTTKTVRVDDADPTTTSNADTAWHNGHFLVSLSASDAQSGVAATYYRLNGGSTMTYTGPFDVTTDGDNDLAFWSVDNVGNVETAVTRNVRVDKTAPATTSNTDTSWHKDVFTVSLTPADALSGVGGTYYSLNGGPATSYTAPFGVTSEGANSLSYWSVDAVGNVEASNTATVRIDKTAAVTESNADGDWHKDSFTVSLTATDALSGVGTTFYTLRPEGHVNGVPTNTYASPFQVTAEGENTLSFWTVDVVGNVETTHTAAVKIDKTAPATTSDVRATYNAAAIVTLSSADARSGVAHVYYSLDGGFPTTLYTGPVSIPAEGRTWLSYYAIDVVGNAEDVKTELVTVDETDPVTTSDATTDWYKGSATISLSATDSLTGVASTHYSVAGGPETTYTAPFTVSAEGTSTVAFWSVDNAGNVESAKAVDVRVDKTAPVTTTSPLTGLYGTASVTLFPADPHSGPAYTRFRLDDSAWTTGTAVSTTVPGRHTLQYFSADVAGNVESVVTTSFSLYARYEQSAAEFIYNGAWLTGTSASYSGGNYRYTSSGGAFKAAFNGTGVEWVTSKGASFGIASVSLDGGDPVLVDLYNATNAHKQRVWSSGGLADGYHTLRIAWTGSRNASATSAYVGVDALDIAGVPQADTTPPSTTSDIDGAWHNADVNVTLTATDTLAGVQTTYYRIGESAQTTYTAPFTVSAEGTTPVTFWSVDAAGVVETAHTQDVHVDKTAPGSAADADDSWHAGDVSVSIEASDAVSGVTGTYSGLNGSPLTAYTAPVLVTAEGVSTLSYRSQDNAGNAETTRTATVRIDRTAPVTTSNVDGAWHKGHFTVALTSTDALSGSATTYYTVEDGAVTTYSAAFDLSAPQDVATWTDVKWWSVDAAGNVEATKTATVKIDASVPRTLATAGDGWHKDHFVVELIAHDSGATPPATYYRLNGGPTATYEDGIDVTSEGMNVLEWWSVDGVGNTEETQSVDVGIDKTAPATTSDVRSHYNATAVVTLTSSDAHSGFPRIYYSLDGSFPTTPYTAPVSIANEGQTLLSYYAVDAVGNAEGVKTELVTVDETAPGTASDVSSAWYKDSATVSLTASDTLTGVAATHYSVAGAPETTYTAPFTISAEGPTAITFWSIDAAGNAEATKSATVRVDKTAPVTTSSPLGSFYGTASATLTATDPYSGVAYTRYRLDGSDWTTGTAVSTSAAGYHTLQYASTDDVGHTESVVTTGFTVYGRYEQTASNLYFTGTWATGNSSSYSGGSYKYTTSGGVFRVAFNGTGVDWITSKGSSFGIASVSLDGADPVLVDLYNPTNLHKQRVWSSGSLANGYHTLRIAWTGQRNASAGNSYVGVDALDIAGAPASDVAAPATTSTIDATWHNANVTVTLTGTDALAGVQNTYYRLGAGATTTYTAPFTVSAEGVTPVTFWSVDAAGNAETAQSAAVRIDKTAPGSAADADNAWHPGDVSVSVTASDAVSGLGTTFYQLNGAAVTTCTGPVNVSAEGANTLAYWSVDAAGNAEAMKTATVRIDRTFPSTASNADTAWHKATFPLTLTASDTPAGLAASYYTVNGGADTTYTGPVSISAEGTNTVVFWSVDRAGNAESRGSAQVLIDLTAPVTSSDATSSYTSTATIHLTASDPLSGVASTSWRADGGAWSSEPVAVVSTPGQHVIEYYSSDVAGNAETHQTRTFTIWKRYEQTEPTLYYEGKWLDASNPAYSGGSYRYMTAAGAANVTFSGTQMTWVTSKGTSFGIARVSVDGGAPTQVDLYSATTQHRQAVWSTGALADGPHTVRIEWTGQRNASATNNYVGVDALDIAGVPTPKRYEQTDPLQYYDGTWYDASNASYSGGSYKYTNSGYTMVSFTGTRVDWITTKGTVFGIAQVSVDGGAPVEVDLYAPSTVHKQKVWSAEGLANTPHTVRIDWTGAKNASASAANVGVDAFDIVGQPMGARYEQSDPSIYLEGTWLEGTSSNYSGGTYRYTNGGNAAVTFAGTSIDWVTTKGPVFGIARVSIDGGAGTDVDLYAATTAYKQKVWSATGLTPGQHTLRIEWTGTKNTAATAANVGIDAVDIVGRPTLAHYEQTATDLRFEGSWLTGTSSSYSGASYKYTFSAGSAVNIAFRGTRIDWITSKGPSFGIARVAVDNGAPVLVDLYAASTANKRVVWSATGLASGLHHVRIEWTGTKNAAATGTNVGIDALDILGVLAPAEDGPMVTRFDEASPQLGWTGGWRTSSSSSFSGGTYRYTAEEGTLTVSFTGTRIDWIGTKTPRSGIASVSVDGGAPVQVDLYAASNVHQQRLWSATGLSEGDHTVTISWTGQHAASASDAYISVDALDIVGTLRQVQ